MWGPAPVDHEAGIFMEKLMIKFEFYDPESTDDELIQSL
jgi:hypothetical protein